MATATGASTLPAIVPLPPDRWPDPERLFGPCGAHGRWCKWWRFPDTEYNGYTAEKHRDSFRVVATTAEHSLRVVAYRDGMSVG